MFPAFVQSFGDQFFAIVLNLIGSVGTALFSSVFSAVSSTVLVPLFEAIVQAITGAAPA